MVVRSEALPVRAGEATTSTDLGDSSMGSLDQLPSERSAGEARIVSGMHREVVWLDWSRVGSSLWPRSES